jgi:hypothetical protein
MEPNASSPQNAPDLGLSKVDAEAAARTAAFRWAAFFGFLALTAPVWVPGLFVMWLIWKIFIIG